MTDPAKFSNRADTVADTLRSFLVAIHTGGLGVVFAVAGSLAGECVNPRWAVCPALIFSAGLVFVGGSLLLAKHKGLKRHDAAKAGVPIPEFKEWWARNSTWDATILGVFVLGVIVGLHNLGSVVVGCP